mgnify:CR=1 FL=1
MTDFSVLDNAIWASLTAGHAAMARANGDARRYPSDVSPLAGLREQSASAFADLRALVDPGEGVALFTVEPFGTPDGWEVVRSRWIDQMIWAGPTEAPSAPALVLGERDAPEMTALAAATEPGPFMDGTIRMGHYIGTRSPEGRLIAMAGERLKPDGFTEISAVCTRPEHRGRGLARSLVALMVARVLGEGRTPFLHVKSENAAKSLYESLGFRFRRAIHLTAITPR